MDEKITGPGGQVILDEAPSDNLWYGRRNTSWDNVVEEVPPDGQQYVRTNSPGSPVRWVPITAGGKHVTEIIPAVATVGLSAALPAIVFGNGFVDGDVVSWDGVPQPTAFISANELGLSIDTNLGVSPSSIEVTVSGATGAAGFVFLPDSAATDFGTGLTKDETQTPPIVHLQPAGDGPPTLGGVYVIERQRNVEEGLELQADGRLRAPLATPRLAGTIVEPEDDGKGYVRTTLNGVSQWVPPADTPLPDFGTGLTLDTSQDPDIVHLQPAGDGPPTLGGVYVVDRQRNVEEGLQLDADGRLRVPLATDRLAGSIVEPENDGKGYVRRRENGVSEWVPPADTPLPDFGTGLSLNDPATPGDPMVVDLDPAGPTNLGGVFVPVRDATTQGLAIDMGDLALGDPATGELLAPPASDLLLGTLTEPVPDGIAYSRQYDIINKKWIWTEALTAGLQITALIPNAVLIGPGEPDVTVRAIGQLFTPTCKLYADGVELTSSAYVSPTEMTFLATPATETVTRVEAITVQDPAVPEVGVGAEPFNYVAVEEGLYRGRWQPAANVPDITALTKEIEWTWTADIVDRNTPELAPATVPGIGGMEINEGDHIVWDGSTFVLVTAGTITDYGIGLTKSPGADPGDPPIVHLQPAGDGPSTLGGVYVIDRQRNNTEGLELGIDGRLRVPLATDSLAGAIVEPPPDDKGYVRRRDLSGVSAWVPPADTPLPGFGIGLTLDDTTPPGTVHLQPAGDSTATLGGVYVVDRNRSLLSGLELGVDGQLKAPPATDTLVGTLVEPPRDSTQYARQWDGTAAWGWTEVLPGGIEDVPADPTGVVYGRQHGNWRPIDTGSSNYVFGIGLNRTGNRIDLNIAGTGQQIGGVRTIGRSPENGLQFDLGTGLITVPLATDVAAGSIVEPKPDDKQYVRTRTVAGVSSWVESTAGLTVHVGDAPPMTANPKDLWFDSDAGTLSLYYEDVDSTAWVQVAGPPPSTLNTIEEAPIDGTPYSRQDAGWVAAAAGGGGLADAPADGTEWLRKDNAWVNPTTTGMSQADADLRYLQLTGGTLSNSLRITRVNSIPGSPTGEDPQLILDRSDIGQGAAVIGRINGADRWRVVLGTAGITGMAGYEHKFQIVSVNDGGGGAVAIELDRNGNMVLGGDLTIYGTFTDALLTSAVEADPTLPGKNSSELLLYALAEIKALKAELATYKARLDICCPE